VAENGPSGIGTSGHTDPKCLETEQNIDSAHDSANSEASCSQEAEDREGGGENARDTLCASE
jgi:hypothetical protein